MTKLVDEFDKETDLSSEFDKEQDLSSEGSQVPMRKPAGSSSEESSKLFKDFLALTGGGAGGYGAGVLAQNKSEKIAGKLEDMAINQAKKAMRLPKEFELRQDLDAAKYKDVPTSKEVIKEALEQDVLKKDPVQAIRDLEKQQQQLKAQKASVLKDSETISLKEFNQRVKDSVKNQLEGPLYNPVNIEKASSTTPEKLIKDLKKEATLRAKDNLSKVRSELEKLKPQQPIKPVKPSGSDIYQNPQLLTEYEEKLEKFKNDRARYKVASKEFRNMSREKIKEASKMDLFNASEIEDIKLTQDRLSAKQKFEEIGELRHGTRHAAKNVAEELVSDPEEFIRLKKLSSTKKELENLLKRGIEPHTTSIGESAAKATKASIINPKYGSVVAAQEFAEKGLKTLPKHAARGLFKTSRTVGSMSKRIPLLGAAIGAFATGAINRAVMADELNRIGMPKDKQEELLDRVERHGKIQGLTEVVTDFIPFMGTMEGVTERFSPAPEYRMKRGERIKEPEYEQLRKRGEDIARFQEFQAKRDLDIANKLRSGEEGIYNDLSQYAADMGNLEYAQFFSDLKGQSSQERSTELYNKMQTDPEFRKMLKEARGATK